MYPRRIEEGWASGASQSFQEAFAWFADTKPARYRLAPGLSELASPTISCSLLQGGIHHLRAGGQSCELQMRRLIQIRESRGASRQEHPTNPVTVRDLRAHRKPKIPGQGTRTIHVPLGSFPAPTVDTIRQVEAADSSKPEDDFQVGQPLPSKQVMWK